MLLKKGGQLLLGGEADAADRHATILEIREEVKTTAVFNLEVASLNTCFVGMDGVVAPNGAEVPAPGRPMPANTDGAFQPGRGSGHFRYRKQANCHGSLDKLPDVWEPTDHSGTHDPHLDRQHADGKYITGYPPAGGGSRRL